jgi:general stress protein 26
MGERARISPEIASLLESGAATWAATSDGEGQPEATRVMGARVSEDGRSLTVYLPTEQSARTLANLERTREITVFFATQTNYRAVQVKGEVAAIRKSRAADKKVQEAYKEKFVELGVAVGVPRALISRYVFWPSTAVEISVRELLNQTPGPNAGTPCR